MNGEKAPRNEKENRLRCRNFKGCKEQNMAGCPSWKMRKRRAVGGDGVEGTWHPLIKANCVKEQGISILEITSDQGINSYE